MHREDTMHYKTMFLAFLYRVAGIKTDDEFFEKFQTNSDEVEGFLKNDPLPVSWTSTFFDCQPTGKDVETFNHLLDVIYGPPRKIQGKIRGNLYSTYQESQYDIDSEEDFPDPDEPTDMEEDIFSEEDSFIEPEDDLEEPSEKTQDFPNAKKKGRQRKENKKRNKKSFEMKNLAQDEKHLSQNQQQWTSVDTNKLAESILKKLIRKIQLGNCIKISDLNREVEKSLSGHKVFLDSIRGAIVLLDESDLPIVKYEVGCEIKVFK